MTQRPQERRFNEFQIIGGLALIGTLVGLLMLWQNPEMLNTGVPVALCLCGIGGLVSFVCGQEISSSQSEAEENSEDIPDHASGE